MPSTTPTGVRRVLRYAAVACAALALVYAVRAWEHASNDVTLVYRGAPPGELVVTLRATDGARLRRAHFGAAAQRSHIVQLPRGTFEATLESDDAPPVRRTFEVTGDATVDLRY